LRQSSFRGDKRQNRSGEDYRKMTRKSFIDSSAFSYKMVIVVRTDIKMSKGKMAAQVGHAAVSASEYARKNRPEWWNPWIIEGQCKIAVKVKSEQEIIEIERKARNHGLPAAIIVDRGLTEIPPNTITCVGIGPAPANKLDSITGNLSLL
jgi:PTH2 family peptidyl-tRNA hydrolase